MSKLARAAGALTLTITAATARAGDLRGSPASMARQHQVAVVEKYEFMDDSAAVRKLVAEKRLVPVAGNEDFTLSRQVSFPYARPEVVEFVERLAAEYRAAVGEPLVVTSLIRVTRWQPRNAHKLSVHPAGMAVDFHPPATPTARAWLERTLLSLEDQGVLDVTRERHPRHYHVAVFPEEYRAWAAANPSPVARPAPAPSPIAAVAAGARDAARSAAAQPHGNDALLVMLAAAAGLAVASFRRRHHDHAVSLRAGAPRQHGGNR